MLINRILLLLLARFVDDLFCAGVASLARTARRYVIELVGILGFSLVAEKTPDPDFELPILGVSTSLSDLHSVAVQLERTKAQLWAEDLISSTGGAYAPS